MIILLLLIIPIITAIACVFTKKHGISKYISIAGSFIALVYNIYLNYNIYTYKTLQGFNNFFYVDALTILTTQIVTIVAFAAALYSAGYMERSSVGVKYLKRSCNGIISLCICLFSRCCWFVC